MSFQLSLRKYPVMRIYPDRVVDAVPKGTTQKEWIREAGFSTFLDVKFNELDRFFLSWLMGRWDPETQLLRIRDDYEIKITDEVVGWIYGLPFSDYTFTIEDSVTEDKEYKKLKTSYSNRGGIGYGIVHADMTENLNNKERFLQSYVLYVFGNLICTTLNNWISPLLCWILKSRYLEDARNWNFSKFVLDWMIKQHKELDAEKGGVKGSPIVLMITYLDRLKLGDKGHRWHTDRPRLGMWQQADIERAIRADSTADGSYGATEVVRDVVYGKEYPIGPRKDLPVWMMSPPPVNPKVTVVERKRKRRKCRAQVRDLKEYKDIQHYSSFGEDETSKGHEEEANVGRTQRSNRKKTNNQELRVVPPALTPARVTRSRSRLIQRQTPVEGDKNVQMKTRETSTTGKGGRTKTKDVITKKKRTKGKKESSEDDLSTESNSEDDEADDDDEDKDRNTEDDEDDEETASDDGSEGGLGNNGDDDDEPNIEATNPKSGKGDVGGPDNEKNGNEGNDGDEDKTVEDGGGEGGGDDDRNENNAEPEVDCDSDYLSDIDDNEGLPQIFYHQRCSITAICDRRSNYTTFKDQILFKWYDVTVNRQLVHKACKKKSPIPIEVMDAFAVYTNNEDSGNADFGLYVFRPSFLCNLLEEDAKPKPAVEQLLIDESEMIDNYFLAGGRKFKDNRKGKYFKQILGLTVDALLEGPSPDVETYRFVKCEDVPTAKSVHETGMMYEKNDLLFRK
ncbi:uncharacterized protein LOC110717772 isoform X3 [Chenopodium quinoa]|uniref:uncharacterized protein LOC110717772 isoform X3 n=1 Tax=Chenopodium quinoa TaxID=63459 RepID=UPI000B773CC5|nr:uncharacterized protein LOC110717772 isoform X3 [Chenopodium quinoa]